MPKRTDIFQERWGHGSRHRFTDEWLRVWAHRASQERARFKCAMRDARIAFAARLAAYRGEDGNGSA